MALGEHERHERQAANHEGADALPGIPRPGLPALKESEDQQRQRDRQEHRTEVVHLVLALLNHLVEVLHEQERREQSERHVDEEDPAPGVERAEDATESGADNRRDTPHRREVALRLRPLSKRVDVARDRDSHRLHRAGAETLHRTECDERRHAPGETAQHRAEKEEADSDEDDGLASNHIRQLRIDRHRDRLRKEVDREQPREGREPAEVPRDGRHGRGEDCCIDGNEPRGHHEGEKHGTTFGAKAEAG